MDIKEFPDFSKLPKLYEDDIKRFEEMSSLIFARAWKANIEAYVFMKLQGVSSNRAYVAAFGPYTFDRNAGMKISCLDANPYTIQLFQKQLIATDVKSMWSLHHSIFTLRSIAMNEDARETARIIAVKELNVLLGITYTDPDGNSRVGSMDDYYRSLEEKAPEAPEVPETEKESENSPETWAG